MHNNTIEKELLINFNQEEILNYLDNQHKILKYNLAMWAIEHNKIENLNLNIKKLDFLIKNSNLMQVNNDKYNLLMFAISFNKQGNLNLNAEQFDYLIKNSYLKQIDKHGNNSLMHVLSNNKEQNLNITQDQFWFLIKNSNLKIVNINGYDSLMFALIFNKKENLNLSDEQFNYLIDSSDLTIKNNRNLRTLDLAILNDFSDKLTYKIIDKMLNLNVVVLENYNLYKNKDNTFNITEIKKISAFWDRYYTNTEINQALSQNNLNKKNNFKL